MLCFMTVVFLEKLCDFVAWLNISIRQENWFWVVDLKINVTMEEEET